jgi:cold shock CspA family protein
LGRSQETFGKREREAKRNKKRKEKELKKAAAKENKMTLDSPDMIGYVDELGQVHSAPPENVEREEIKLEDIEISVAKKEDIEEDPIRKGIVSMFNDDKGFGFIRDLDSQDSVFVHISNVKAEELREGNKVQFEIEVSPKGKAAVRVEIAP